MKFSPEIEAAVAHGWQAYDLDPELVRAVVAVESCGNPYAVRYEPGYRYLFDPPRVRPGGCSVDTETVLQKTSWGLMQVMGAVLRERGYQGWLTAILSDPIAQVEYGCRHLKSLINRWGIPGGIAAYNAGHPRRDAAGNFVNADYVEKVMAEKGKSE